MTSCEICGANVDAANVAAHQTWHVDEPNRIKRIRRDEAAAAVLRASKPFRPRP